MTKQDMTERFKIPETVLNDYERNVRKTHTESYTDADLALLSQMVTLYEIGSRRRNILGWTMCGAAPTRCGWRF